MFNSTILDVAIGMIFIYLLLSLMCSAANEIIELLLKKRAIDLEQAIREMLNGNSNPGSQDIVQDFYNHPLINGLFEGSYEGSRIANKMSWVRRTLLPSYIPARNFALAIMDLVVPGGGAGGQESGAAGATAGAPVPAIPPQAVAGAGGVVPPAAIPPAHPVPDAAVAALRAALLAGANAQGAGAAAAARQIPQQMRQALIPLIDAAGNDITKVRENIEGWFNASMERASGWYKRRSQVTLAILGLFIAVTVNVDTITVVKRLSTDKALRESLVAASDAYAKASVEAPSSHSGGAATPPASQNSPAVCTIKPDSEECKLAKACNDPESPNCKYVTNLQQINALGLPIGWDDKNDPKRNWTGLALSGLWDQLVWHWLGWLLTALAISLGAPFWFDLLNKFIAIRSAVKPKETTPGV
jgi:hypothetical protein